MKTELITKIEAKLKANLFDGLLLNPAPNIDEGIAQTQNLISFIESINKLNQNEFLNKYDRHTRFFQLQILQNNKINLWESEPSYYRYSDEEKEKILEKYNELKNEVATLLNTEKFDACIFLFSKHSQSFGYHGSDINRTSVESGLRHIKAEFDKELEDYKSKTSIVESIVKQLPKYLDAENFDPRDTIIINVGRRATYDCAIGHGYKLGNSFEVFNNKKSFKYTHTADVKDVTSYYADIFVITNKYFINLSIGETGLIERTEHLLREIKKVSLAGDEVLEIFFHGHFDAATIVLDSYADSLALQRKLTNLREVKKDFRHPNGARKENQFHKK